MIGFIAFWFGLICGSFLNVCIHRLPREESLIRPRSRCPHCRRMIAWYDNIPVLSFLWLGFRCRHCGKAISWRYPLVELLSGSLLWSLWWRWQGFGMWFVAAFTAAAILIVIAFIDWDTFLIPDILSLSLLALGVASAPWNPYFYGGAIWSLGRSMMGAVVGFLICYGIAAFGEWVLQKDAMGGGDVKLLAAVGAWSGVLGVFNCLMVASLLGTMYGVPLIVLGELRRQDPIPFGPFLSAAAIFNFFYLIPFGFMF